MARQGSQRPTFERTGGYARTDGDEAVELFRSYGFGFDGAQAHLMRLYLAKDSAGQPAAIQVAASVPRQNGKSYAARWYAVWCAAVCGMEVIYSAHNGDTVDEFFRMLCGVFEDGDAYPDFAEMLSCEPYRQPGKQWMRFVSGGRIRFGTRTNNKIRGGTAAVIVVDEAQELTDAQLNALLPSSSASPSGPPQVVMVGTPPDPTCLGTVFKRLHDEAHASAECQDSWWVEWAAEEMPAPDATAEDAVEAAYRTNPALGSRITERAVRNEFHTMTRDGFARERLGWWRPGGTVEYLIGRERWDALLTDDPMEKGRLAYGVKFSADGRRVALSAALAVKNGPAYVELVDVLGTENGAGRLREWLMERSSGCCAAAIDGRSGAAALAASLRSVGFPRRALVECRTSDAVAAASMFVEEVFSKTVSHIASPALDESVAGAVRRPIGGNGGFGFGDGPESDSTAAESAALALWAARTSKRDPDRKMRVG